MIQFDEHIFQMGWKPPTRHIVMQPFRTWLNDVQHVWSVCLFGRSFFCLEVCVYIYIWYCKLQIWWLGQSFSLSHLIGFFPESKGTHFFQTWKLNRKYFFGVGCEHMWTTFRLGHSQSGSIAQCCCALETRKGDGKEETFCCKGIIITCRVICLLGIFHNLLALYDLHKVHNHKTGPVGSSLTLLVVGGIPTIEGVARSDLIW